MCLYCYLNPFITKYEHFEKWGRRCKIQLSICVTRCNSQFVVIFQNEIFDLFEE